VDDRRIAGFDEDEIATEHGAVFVRRGGAGPPVLLLHGFPETGLMWHAVAPTLATNFSVIVADLPGYGRSDCPPDREDHAAMSKRALAQTLVRAMTEIGHDRFAVVGHDRGGRVAYRMALDHADAVTKVAVLDVIPTAEVWSRADDRLALGFWPFSLLAQPAPLPERLIAGDPAAVVENALSQWGSAADAFPEWLRDAYVEALSDPTHVHAICEEYRAAASIDRHHDEADRIAGRRIACPLLALWSDSGGLETWYEDAGGPLGLWRRWAEDVDGQAISGGHFFPEEQPEVTATLLRTFLHRK
jgi:haloacetate dehalogenase